jgi:hypothetical protein
MWSGDCFWFDARAFATIWGSIPRKPDGLLTVMPGANSTVTFPVVSVVRLHLRTHEVSQSWIGHGGPNSSKNTPEPQLHAKKNTHLTD